MRIALLLILFVTTFCSDLADIPISSTSRTNSAFTLTRKRLIKELKEIKEAGLTFETSFAYNSIDECGIRLYPLKNNMLEWHFSFTGMEDTSYDRGIYHGRIILHPSYPIKAPVIMLLTPNGRWETFKAICLSATSHHQETWDPNWNLRTLVMALRNHMISQPNEIGGILTTADVQRHLARMSQAWHCPLCGAHHSFLCTGERPVAVSEERPTIIQESQSRQLGKKKRRRKETAVETSFLRRVALFFLLWGLTHFLQKFLI